MAEQEPQYDPAVEELIETSGPDIGRIKDKNTAEGFAKVEDNAQGLPTGMIAVGVDNLIRDEVAARAVKNSPLTKTIVDAATSKYSRTDEQLMEEAIGAKINAIQAADSYDSLQEVSRPANNTQEVEYLKNNLAEARQKIAESDKSQA